MKRLELFKLLLARIIRRQKLKLLAIILQIALGVFIVIPSISFLLHYKECNKYFENYFGSNTYVVTRYSYDLNNVTFNDQEIENVRQIAGVQSTLAQYTSKNENKEEVILGAMLQQNIIMSEIVDLTRIKMIDSQYVDFFSLPIEAGRNFTEEDINDKNRVVILSEEAAKIIFSKTDVLGNELKLGDLGNYTVIGIVESQYKGFDFDTKVLDLYFPYSCFISEEESRIDSMMIKGEKTQLVEEHMQQLKIAIEEQLPNTLIGVNQYVKSMIGNLEYFRVNAYISLLFGIILLLISFLGNVGIALASFYRRLKVYGTELIIGATYKEIAFQIFTENMIVFIIGTVIGALLNIPLRQYLSNINSFYAGAGLPIGTIIITFIVTIMLAIASSLVIVVKLYRRSIVEIMR